MIRFASSGVRSSRLGFSCVSDMGDIRNQNGDGGLAVGVWAARHAREETERRPKAECPAD